MTQSLKFTQFAPAVKPPTMRLTRHMQNDGSLYKLTVKFTGSQQFARSIRQFMDLARDGLEQANYSTELLREPTAFQVTSPESDSIAATVVDELEKYAKQYGFKVVKS